MQKPARYQCNSCGALQADGAWEKAMTAQARAIGKKGFVNLSAPPECLNCKSIDLTDLLHPPSNKEKREKETIRRLPELRKVVDYLEAWERADKSIWEDLQRYGSTDETRSRLRIYNKEKEKMEKSIRRVGDKLTKDGRNDLLYKICRSLDKTKRQEIVSSCWLGLPGWDD